MIIGIGLTTNARSSSVLQSSEAFLDGVSLLSPLSPSYREDSRQLHGGLLSHVPLLCTK